MILTISDKSKTPKMKIGFWQESIKKNLGDMFQLKNDLSEYQRNSKSNVT